MGKSPGSSRGNSGGGINAGGASNGVYGQQAAAVAAAAAAAAQHAHALAAAGVLGGAFLELGSNAAMLGRSVARQANTAQLSLQTHFKEAIRYVRAVRSAVEDLVGLYKLSSIYP
jgi:hypothetical protein